MLLKLFPRHFSDKIIRGVCKRSPSVLVLVLVDLDGCQDLVAQFPGDVLGQSVGVGREDSLEIAPPCKTNVFQLKKDDYLKDRRKEKLIFYVFNHSSVSTYLRTYVAVVYNYLDIFFRCQI